MILLHRDNSKSAALLLTKIKDIAPNFKVSWGITSQGVFGGTKRYDAMEQLTAFKNAGIRTIEYTQDYAEAKRWVAQRIPVFGRLFEHTQGTDIVGPRDKRFAKRQWWCKFVPSVEEWRIHCMKFPSGTYRSIARGKKVQVEEPWRKLLVRNRSNGWRLDHTTDPPEAVREAAKAAVAACGYDFGAVDLLVLADNSVVVLEVNKAPGLDDYTASKYAEALRKVAAKQ